MATRKRTTRQGKNTAFARRSPTPRGVARDATPAGRKKAKGGQQPAPSDTISAQLDPIAYARGLVRDIPDFPKPGILFRDITPLLANPKGFHITLDTIAQHFVGEHVDAIVAIESRGFIFGGALAARLNASFVPVRKPGKLPGPLDSVSYDLEYGTDTLEIHRDALWRDARVVVVDDLLATGGTAQATGKLVAKQGARVIAYAFVVELDALDGRRHLAPAPVVSLLHYE